MISYGLGDAGTGLVATQFGFFLFKFFISAGLPVIIAGSLLMLIKIWDAVNDPLIGWLSDRTNSRWGPRIIDSKSGRRESNPHLQLGRLRFYH